MRREIRRLEENLEEEQRRRAALETSLKVCGEEGKEEKGERGDGVKMIRRRRRRCLLPAVTGEASTTRYQKLRLRRGVVDEIERLQRLVAMQVDTERLVNLRAHMR